ncbi:MAG: hypothetical protein HC911_17550 [Chloroflexaceae bacterium]|nr:hypothetical protein [Chloroflexaceae bacterium]
MADQSTIGARIQIGAEAVAGTAVAATRRLRAINGSPEFTQQVDTFKGSGSRAVDVAALNMEMATFGFDGFATYEELPVLLDALIKKHAAPTADGTNGKRYVYAPSVAATDVPSTYTIEYGSNDGRGTRMAYSFVDALSVNFGRDGIKLSGSFTGRALQDNHTLTTTGITEYTLTPVLATNLAIYVADTWNNLDVPASRVKMGRVLQGTYSIGSRWAPLTVLDQTTSFATHLENEQQQYELSLKAGWDAQSMGYLDELRQGKTIFVRIEAIGDAIAGATPSAYTLQIDSAMKLTGFGKLESNNNLVAIDFKGMLANDPVAGRFTEITVINTNAAVV